eukprot:scaffold128784_cov39-Tisochrysis_lutea.AAC.1
MVRDTTQGMRDGRGAPARTSTTYIGGMPTDIKRSSRRVGKANQAGGAHVTTQARPHALRLMA